jgi:hypothetical protein
MNKLLLVLTLVFAGCVSADILRTAKYEIKCTDCKTPYGTGNVVSVTVEKLLQVNRCQGNAQ